MTQQANPITGAGDKERIFVLFLKSCTLNPDWLGLKGAVDAHSGASPCFLLDSLSRNQGDS